MDRHQIKDLLHKYENGTCTELEKAQLETWYLQQEIPHKLDLTESELNAELRKIWAGLAEEYNGNHKGGLWKKLAIAAAVLFVLSFGFYYMINYHKADTSAKDEAWVAANVVKPGGDKAVYIDPTGKQQELNDELFVAPLPNEDLSSAEVGYNTIETPKGGQYQVVLADGTHVWLNAASSLTYPNSFNGKERVVELTGEAYFEVKHMAGKPFRVISRNQVIHVLGTHFNVNTYDDEPAIQTTLLEGSVEVSISGKHRMLLKPGEQSLNAQDGISKRKIDVEKVVAWKMGIFHFENTPLETVFRQLSRWYNVEVDIKEIPHKRFNGILPRDIELPQILTMMEKTSGLKFKVEEGRISMLN